ncbi:MAG: ATP-binding protein [Chloroflexota bacterium]
MPEEGALHPGADGLDYRQLFEAAPGLFLVLDPDLEIVAVSDAYLRATMTEREAIIGRHLFEVFPDDPNDPAADGVANLRASLDRVRALKRPDSMAVQRYAIRRPEAEGGGFEERWWSPINSPVLDAGGRLRQIIHRVEDVTDFVRATARETEQVRLNEELRSRAETMQAEILRRVEEIAAADRELRRLTAELERFFSLSSDMFGVFNLDGTFRRVNDAWRTVLGYEPDELVGRPFLDLVHEDDRVRTIAEFERATREGTTTTRFENRYRHADGSYRWLDWTGRLVPGESVHYSAARDVTERKEVDAALDSARRAAESANRAKSEFLSRMSHELRTPLNAVLGFAQLLQADDLTPDQQESVAYIIRAGRHLLELINEVLDISRIEAGEMTISPEPVAVGDLVVEVVGLVTPLATATSVTIDGGAATCDTHVMADRQRLRQVLLNILSNAVKYNRDGGTASVRCSHLDGRHRIAISDTGFGIPADQFERLFAPFDRLGADRSSIEGTGMGLALSKGLVEAMGGSIGVESEVGRGSTFWIELEEAAGQLEALETSATAMATRSGPGSGQPTRLVLYIEDNLSNLRLIERILARHPDVELVSATTGELGLELATSRRPDVILLDLHLPDLPGRDVLRRLRSRPATRSIPVIVISADATRSQVGRLMRDGVAGYLTKPIDVAAFMTLVDRTLNDPSGSAD